MSRIGFHQFLSQFSTPTLPKIFNIKYPFDNKKNQTLLSPSITKIYKWRNDGVWHFSEQAPKNVTSVQTIFIHSNTNILSAEQASKTTKNLMAHGDEKNTAQKSAQLNLNPYSQKAIKKLISDANNVQQIMNERAILLK